jgi:hypothetical protein
MGRGQEMAERLVGSCDTMPPEMEDFTMEELHEFDDLVFQCACGWWCDVGEMAPDGEHCDQCLGDDEDEDGEE